MEVPVMSLIKPKRRRGPKLLWLILVIVLVVVAGAGYVYFIVNGVNSSDEMKAEYVDYLFYWQSADNPLYYYVRTTTVGRTSLVIFPIFATIQNSKEVLDPQLGADAVEAVQSWLGTSGDFSYFVNFTPDLIDALSSKLGVNASNPVELIDAMALRGFKLFDYWKINDFVQTVKEYDGASILTSEGIAVLLRRLGNSSRMTYKLETLTEFPMKISVGVGGETVSRMYLKPDSLETVKKALAD
jgi:hypothetical protein